MSYTKADIATIKSKLRDLLPDARFHEYDYGFSCTMKVKDHIWHVARVFDPKREFYTGSYILPDDDGVLAEFAKHVNGYTDGFSGPS